MKTIILMILAITMNGTTVLAQQQAGACAFEDDNFVQNFIFRVSSRRTYRVPRNETVGAIMEVCKSRDHDECVAILVRPGREIEQSCWFDPLCYALGGGDFRFIPAQYRVEGRSFEPRRPEAICPVLEACRNATAPENPQRSNAIERLHGFYCAQ